MEHIALAITELRARALQAGQLADQLEAYTRHVPVAFPAPAAPAPVPIERAKPRRAAGISKDAPKVRALTQTTRLKSGGNLAGGNFGVAIRGLLAGLNGEFSTHWLAERLPADLQAHPDCNTRIAGVLFNMRTAGEIILQRREKTGKASISIYRVAKPGQTADEWAKFREANPTPKLIKADDMP
jgi:hypothetical protein